MTFQIGDKVIHEVRHDKRNKDKSGKLTIRHHDGVVVGYTDACYKVRVPNGIIKKCLKDSVVKKE